MVQCMTSTAAIADTLGLDALNQQFETATPQDILRWAIRTFPTGLAQTNSFSIPVTIHMLYKELSTPRRVPVIFLDTLHHFEETLATAERARQRYDLDLHVYQATGATTRQAFASRYGDELWHRNIDQFHYLTKVEPLQRALQDVEVKAWVTGRRRDQSANRKAMPILEQDGDGRLKINPLANWSRKELWGYVFQQDVVYNPLHDRGYASIGDEPLTTPVQPGEDERAGRWRDSTKTECGIHL
jgi:phosphoadenosine phosphosulfate reductase